MKGNRFIAAIFCMPAMALMIVSSATATLSTQFKASSKSKIRKEQDRHMALAKQDLSLAERELLDFLGETRATRGQEEDDSVALNRHRSFFDAKGRAVVVAVHRDQGSAALGRGELKTVNGEQVLVTENLAYKNGVRVDGELVDVGPLFDQKLQAFDLGDGRILVVVEPHEEESRAVYIASEDFKNLTTVVVTDPNGNAGVTQLYTAKSLPNGGFVVIGDGGEKGVVEQVVTSGAVTSGSEAEVAAVTSAAAPASERIVRPRFSSPGVKFRGLSAVFEPSEEEEEVAVVTSGAVTSGSVTSGAVTSGVVTSGANDTSEVEEEEAVVTSGDQAAQDQGALQVFPPAPLPARRVLKRPFVATFDRSGNQVASASVGLGSESDGLARSRRGSSAFAVHGANDAATAQEGVEVLVGPGGIPTAVTPDGSVVLGFHARKKRKLNTGESSVSRAGEAVAPQGGSGTVFSVVVVAPDGTVKPFVANAKSRWFESSALPFASTGAGQATRGEGEGRGTTGADRLAYSQNMLFVLQNDQSEPKDDGSAATSGRGRPVTSGAASNTTTQKAFQVTVHPVTDDGSYGYQQPDGTVVAATRASHMQDFSLVADSLRAYFVGGLPSELQEQFGGVPVEDMLVRPDGVVLVALAGPRLENRGVFMSKPVYRKNTGIIESWTYWKSISQPIAAYKFVILPNSSFLFKSTASGDPDGSPVNTLHATALGRTDDVLEIPLSSFVADNVIKPMRASSGNQIDIENIFFFSSDRSGIAANTSIMAVTLPQTVIFIKRSAPREEGGKMVEAGVEQFRLNEEVLVYTGDKKAAAEIEGAVYSEVLNNITLDGLFPLMVTLSPSRGLDYLLSDEKHEHEEVAFDVHTKGNISARLGVAGQVRLGRGLMGVSVTGAKRAAGINLSRKTYPTADANFHITRIGDVKNVEKVLSSEFGTVVCAHDRVQIVEDVLFKSKSGRRSVVESKSVFEFSLNNFADAIIIGNKLLVGERTNLTASGAARGPLWVYDFATGRLHHAFAGHDFSPQSFSFLPQGGSAGTSEGILRVMTSDSQFFQFYVRSDINPTDGVADSDTTYLDAVVEPYPDPHGYLGTVRGFRKVLPAGGPLSMRMVTVKGSNEVRFETAWPQGTVDAVPTFFELRVFLDTEFIRSDFIPGNNGELWSFADDQILVL